MNLFRRKKNKNLPTTSTPLSNLASSIPSRTSSMKSRQGIEDELEQVFKKFDINGDGKICSVELSSILASLGSPASEAEIANMIKEVDKDGDGYIDLEEFIELNTKGIDSEELLANIRDAFSVFDIDKNGSISADELYKVLKSIGEEFTLEECKNMINCVDANGDGLICFEEFKVMMMKGERNTVADDGPSTESKI